MADCEDQKQRIIEGLLDNEALTDGLSDEAAQSLLNWCEAQVAAFRSTAECTLADYGRYLSRQARTMAQLVAHIEDGDSRDRIEQRLRQLTDNPVHQAGFIRLLDKDRTTQDYLQALYGIVSGSK